MFYVFEYEQNSQSNQAESWSHLGYLFCLALLSVALTSRLKYPLTFTPRPNCNPECAPCGSLLPLPYFFTTCLHIVKLSFKNSATQCCVMSKASSVCCFLQVNSSLHLPLDFQHMLACMLSRSTHFHNVASLLYASYMLVASSMLLPLSQDRNCCHASSVLMPTKL